MLCHHSGELLWAHGAEELFVTLILVKIFRYIKIQSNLYVTALYITVTGQLPKIFSCIIFSAKMTCI